MRILKATHLYFSVCDGYTYFVLNGDPPKLVLFNVAFVGNGGPGILKYSELHEDYIDDLIDVGEFDWKGISDILDEHYKGIYDEDNS